MDSIKVHGYNLSNYLITLPLVANFIIYFYFICTCTCATVGAGSRKDEWRYWVDSDFLYMPIQLMVKSILKFIIFELKSNILEFNILDYCVALGLFRVAMFWYF